MSGLAVFSADQKYRYRLERFTGLLDASGCVNFIMLNPSTADAEKNDPTVRRCIGYARLWRYHRLIVTNLFALRSTDPAALQTELDPIGPDNDRHLATAAAFADRIVAAWGNHGALRDRSSAVLDLLDQYQVQTFGLTKAGEPVHPLYQRQAALLIPLQQNNEAPNEAQE